MWTTIINRSRKKGEFTQEEDELIIKRVLMAHHSTSTGKQCYGLWVSIGKELGRSQYAILHRWNRVLSKRKELTIPVEQSDSIVMNNIYVEK